MSVAVLLHACEQLDLVKEFFDFYHGSCGPPRRASVTNICNSRNRFIKMLNKEKGRVSQRGGGQNYNVSQDEGEDQDVCT